MALLNPASWQRWKQIMNHRYLRIQRCCWWERCCSPASSDRHPCGLARHALHSHALHHTMLPLHAPHHTTPCPPASIHQLYFSQMLLSEVWFSFPYHAMPPPPNHLLVFPGIVFFNCILTNMYFPCHALLPPVTCSHHPSPTIRASLEPSMVQVTMTNDVQESKDGFSGRVGWEPNLGGSFESFFSF